MSGTLFLKECRKTVKSIIFLIYIAVLICFMIAQYIPSVEKINKPQPGQANYGMKYEEVPKIIMPKAVKELYNEFAANSYIAYPLGFYKNVRLSTEEQAEIAQILSKLTGTSSNNFSNLADNKSAELKINTENMTKDKNGNISVTLPDNANKTDIPDNPDVTIDKELTYEQFRSLMKKADTLIGGGSKYSDTYLIRFGEIPKTYEDAIAEYNDIVGRDNITGAYARLFCDYIGIALAIFPVFIAVAFIMRDRRSGMQDLIYTRKKSSFTIVLTRYIAMVAMMFLPVLLMALYATIQTADLHTGYQLDYLVFIKYSFGWLLPTLMVSISVGVFLTELTNTPVAIIVQGIWWFICTNTGIRHIDGGYGADLIIRHNKVGNTQVYLDNINTLLINRIGYAIFAVMLIAASIGIYEIKRRGRFANYRFRKIFAHLKNKHKA